MIFHSVLLNTSIKFCHGFICTSRYAGVNLHLYCISGVGAVTSLQAMTSQYNVAKALDAQRKSGNGANSVVFPPQTVSIDQFGWHE